MSLTEAVKFNVLPLDDRVLERFNPAVAGRPDLIGGRTSLTLAQFLQHAIDCATAESESLTP